MMRPIRRPSARQLLVGLPALAGFVLLFWPTWAWMAERFAAHDSFYSHGWLIPLASGWLIWQRRRSFQPGDRRPSFWGVALLVPAVLLHLLATWWQVHVVSGFAMVGALWGLVWTAWGWRTLWALRFPLLFLLFMVPLPGVVLISISFAMKLFAAKLATGALTFLGVPALQAGSTIRVPGVSVVIDDTCSGLRSLISLIALATLWTSLMGPQAKRWHRLTVVAAAIPIAVGANMVRILVLVLLAAIYGPGIARGFVHYGSGVVVFGLALLALAWLSSSLVRRSRAMAGGTPS